MDKIINSNSSLNIKYKGIITVSLERNNKCVSKKIFHNAGTEYLFNFIVQCIAGNYENAEALRPIYLNIYSKDAASQQIPQVDIDVDFTEKKNLTTIVASTAVGISQIAGGYSALFKFRVPVAQLNTARTSESLWYSNLNLLALFSKQYYTMNKPSAYAFATDNTDEEPKVISLIPKELWGPSGVRTEINDYVLNIQWEMQFTNN